MKRPRDFRLRLGLLALALAALAGCVSVHSDDSDIPWNVASPNDGVPTLPGMNQ